MPEYLAVLTIVLMIGMVVARVVLLRREGVEAFQFGKMDKRDYLIPPFALLYFYLVLARAFGWPGLGGQVLFQVDLIPWVGVAFCFSGLGLLFWSLLSFRKSFRVGIDEIHPDKLITTGVFAVTRNPIYVAFGCILFGQFLIFPNWVFLGVVLAGSWLFNRQVLLEEDFLKQHYGSEYLDYCKRVRRYL